MITKLAGSGMPPAFIVAVTPKLSTMSLGATAGDSPKLMTFVNVYGMMTGVTPTLALPKAPLTGIPDEELSRSEWRWR